MKYFHQKLNTQQGFSTVEMLIAFVVVILSITTVIGVVFGSQSITLDTETSQEAQLLATGLLENARAESRVDLDSVSEVSATETIGNLIYNKKTNISGISPCAMYVDSLVTWTNETRPQSVSVSTILTNPDELLEVGEDCLSSPAIDEWRNPDTLSTEELNPSGNQGTDIDITGFNDKKYAFITSIHSSSAKPDFWIVDVTDPANPSLTIANPDQGLDTGLGLNKLDVAKNIANGKYYAYVGNNDSANQLQIIEVTDVTNPSIVKNCTLPGVSGPDPQATSIYFYNDKVYIGTHRTAGNELHVYDVSNLSKPCGGPGIPNSMWLGSREVNHNLNDIVVNGDYIYIATSSDGAELTVLDIGNPSSITPTFTLGVPDPGFDAPGNEDGTALHKSANKIYLGRTKSTSSDGDVHILNVTSPQIPFSLGKFWLNMNPSGAQINGIVVLGKLAFIATSDSNGELQIWDISTPTSAQLWTAPFNFPNEATGLDFDDNIVYSSVRANAALRIIYDNP